jgi:DNA-damage-inducible protein J
MSKSAMIRARTDSDLKKKVELIFDTLGLNATAAINIFYRQVLLTNGIPFDVKIPNASTRKAMKEAKAGKINRAKNAEDLFKILRA